MSVLLLGTLDSSVRDEYFSDYVKRLEFLSHAGLDCKFVGTRSYTDGGFFESLEKEMPGSVLYVTKTNAQKAGHILRWPRDAFLDLGNRIIACPGYESMVKDCLAQLHDLRDLEVHPVGEGGYSIHDNGSLFIAREDHLAMPNITPHATFVSYRPQEYLHMGHLDTKAAVLEGQAFVQESLLHQFPHLSYAFEKKGYSVISVPKEDWMLVNMISIDDSVIIDDRVSHNLKGKLESLANVIAVKTLPGEVSKSYGLRCGSNVIIGS
ncbi:MAG: hypothetical protein ACMXYK_00985 [Candidatus Woesearchaeota archaeon]